MSATFYIEGEDADDFRSDVKRAVHDFNHDLLLMQLHKWHQNGLLLREKPEEEIIYAYPSAQALLEYAYEKQWLSELMYDQLKKLDVNLNDKARELYEIREYHHISNDMLNNKIKDIYSSPPMNSDQDVELDAEFAHIFKNQVYEVIANAYLSEQADWERYVDHMVITLFDFAKQYEREYGVNYSVHALLRYAEENQYINNQSLSGDIINKIRKTNTQYDDVDKRAKELSVIRSSMQKERLAINAIRNNIYNPSASPVAAPTVPLSVSPTTKELHDRHAKKAKTIKQKHIHKLFGQTMAAVEKAKKMSHSHLAKLHENPTLHRHRAENKHKKNQ